MSFEPVCVFLTSGVQPACLECPKARAVVREACRRATMRWRMSDEWVDDVVQQLLETLARHGVAVPVSYLRRWAVWAARDLFKRSGGPWDSVTARSSSLSDRDEELDVEAEPDNARERFEAKRDALALLDTLSPERRAVVVKRFGLDGRPPRDFPVIAVEMSAETDRRWSVAMVARTFKLAMEDLAHRG